MKEKVYINKNVYEATMERLDFIFSEFDNIYVAFSGGKDSGVLWNLTLKYMAEHNIRRKIGLFHQDFEAQYQETSRYVERTFTTAPDYVDKFWCCMPFRASNNVSFSDNSSWYTWDEAQKEIWVRLMPEYTYVYSQNKNPFDFFVYHMTQEDFYKKFSFWYKEHCGGGRTIALVGVTTDESLNRYRALVGKIKMYKKQAWTHDLGKDCYTAFPLYDWKIEDIWVANGKFGFDYNKIYDLMYKVGVPLKKQRVASPFLVENHAYLKLYKNIDPYIWERMLKRVRGANFGAIYGDTIGLGYHELKKPKDYTWQNYAKFLILTIPEKDEEQYINAYKACIDEQNFRNLCKAILRHEDKVRFGNFGIIKKIKNDKQEKIAEKKSKYTDIMKGLN